ncbi:MAG: NAD-dependent epimerase/dehydratase family protein [Vulcanimicrobiaceae bacterium]
MAATWGSALAELSGTTLLISGAGGFLCSFVLDVIAALNEVFDAPVTVIAMDNYKTGLPERIAHLNDYPNMRVVNHDVSTAYVPDCTIDWIIHGASIASPSFYRRYPLETIDANVSGTRHMLELARTAGVKGYLQLSSSEIYGDPEPAAIPTAEEYTGRVSCTGPRACYDESKRLGETLSMTYHRLYSVPVKIVRPFNVYGPGQRLDDARIIPDMVSAAIEDRPIVLFSDGRATRAFCYISDFVAGMLLVMVRGAGGEAYNVGNDEETSIAQAAQTMVEIAGSSNVAIEYRISDDREYLTGNPQRRCPNLKKVFAATGWRPGIGLAEGFERTLRSYRTEIASV